MNRNSFIQELRHIFEKNHVADAEAIIQVYEEHFILAKEQGQSESEIIAALGTPQEIYDAYVEEGVVDETKDVGGTNSINMNAIVRQLQAYRKEYIPKLPGFLKWFSHTALRVLSVICYVLAVLAWVVTPAITYLLSIQWQPFANATPLPAISVMTLICFVGAGVFGGATLWCTGSWLHTVRRWIPQQ